MIGVKMFDVHLPVVPVKKNADGGLEAPKALIYGTAFPILPGLFVTAGHVFKAVRADGIPALGNMGDGGALKVSEVVDAEVFEAIDLALMVCPGLEGTPPIPLEFDYQLDRPARVEIWERTHRLQPHADQAAGRHEANRHQAGQLAARRSRAEEEAA